MNDREKVLAAHYFDELRGLNKMNDFLESLEQWFEEKGFLTPKQFARLEDAWREATET